MTTQADLVNALQNSPQFQALNKAYQDPTNWSMVTPGGDESHMDAVRTFNAPGGAEAYRFAAPGFGTLDMPTEQNQLGSFINQVNTGNLSGINYFDGNPDGALTENRLMFDPSGNVGSRETFNTALGAPDIDWKTPALLFAAGVTGGASLGAAGSGEGAALGSGLSAGGGGTGLTMGAGGATGLTAGGSSLGLTTAGASSGALGSLGAGFFPAETLGAGGLASMGGSSLLQTLGQKLGGQLLKHGLGGASGGGIGGSGGGYSGGSSLQSSSNAPGFAQETAPATTPQRSAFIPNQPQAAQPLAQHPDNAQNILRLAAALRGPQY